jgi:hypothetical protein
MVVAEHQLIRRADLSTDGRFGFIGAETRMGEPNRQVVE